MIALNVTTQHSEETTNMRAASNTVAKDAEYREACRTSANKDTRTRNDGERSSDTTKANGKGDQVTSARGTTMKKRSHLEQTAILEQMEMVRSETLQLFTGRYDSKTQSTAPID